MVTPKKYFKSSSKKNKKTEKKVKENNTKIFSNNDEDVLVELESLFSNSSYTLHPRVTRWETATEHDIANFDLHRKRNYSKLDNKAKRHSRCVHYLPGAELVLAADDSKKYFFDTDKGVSACATMQIGNGPVVAGILELGIGNQEGKK